MGLCGTHKASRCPGARGDQSDRAPDKPLHGARMGVARSKRLHAAVSREPLLAHVAHIGAVALPEGAQVCARGFQRRQQRRGRRRVGRCAVGAARMQGAGAAKGGGTGDGRAAGPRVDGPSKRCAAAAVAAAGGSAVASTAGCGAAAAPSRPALWYPAALLLRGGSLGAPQRPSSSSSLPLSSLLLAAALRLRSSGLPWGVTITMLLMLPRASASVWPARSITQQPSTRNLKRWMPGGRPCSGAGEQQGHEQFAGGSGQRTG